jgi:hypothetical protein
MTDHPVVEQLYEVWKVIEWKDGSVFKTVYAGEVRWLTHKEVEANHPVMTGITFTPMSNTYPGQTIRTRKT